MLKESLDLLQDLRRWEIIKVSRKAARDVYSAHQAAASLLTPLLFLNDSTCDK